MIIGPSHTLPISGCSWPDPDNKGQWKHSPECKEGKTPCPNNEDDWVPTTFFKPPDDPMTCSWCSEPIPDGTSCWARGVSSGPGTYPMKVYHPGDCWESGLQRARSVETRWTPDGEWPAYVPFTVKK